MSATTKHDVAVTKKGSEMTAAAPATLGSMNEMERIFERLMPRGWLSPFRRGEWPLASGWAERMGMDWHVPAVDILDGDKNLTVRVELPGVDKKDVEVTSSENTLTVKTKARRESEEKRGDYFRCEISQSASARTVALPCNIDPDSAKAALKDGILEVTLTKVDGARRHPVTIE